MQTQKQAEQLAAQRAKRKRYVSVEVHVSEYVTAEIPLSKIPTGDLLDELRDRSMNGDKAAEGPVCGEVEFTLDTGELYAIRHLFLIGREVEAAERCRLLLQEMLGTAI